MEQQLVLGVDAGGSGSRWALGVATGAVIAEGTGPAIQLANLGVAEAAARVLELLRDPCARANQMSSGRLGAIVAGFAGAGDATRRAALAEALLVPGRALGAAALRLVTDLEIAAALAFPESAGVAAWAGTGSFVIARDERGALQRVGGRGPLLGDAGSGYDLVRQAARLALLGLDGIGEAPAALAEALVAHFGAPSLARLGVALQNAPAGAVAAAAPLVLESAARQDPHARRAVIVAFAGLADLVVAVVARARIAAERVAIGGSVLLQSDLAREAFAAALARRGLPLPLAPVTAAPAQGALRLASAWLSRAEPLRSWVEHGAA